MAQLWLKILPMLPGLCAGFFLPLPAGMIVLTIAIVMATPILTARLSRTAFIAMISCLTAAMAANSMFAWRVLSD